MCKCIGHAGCYFWHVLYGRLWLLGAHQLLGAQVVLVYSCLLLTAYTCVHVNLQHVEHIVKYVNG